MVNCTSPPLVEEPVEVGVAPPLDEPEAAAQEPREKAPAKYSTLFKMGLFFSVSYSLVPCFSPIRHDLNLQQVTHHLDRAIEGVKIKLGSRSRERSEPLAGTRSESLFCRPLTRLVCFLAITHALLQSFVSTINT